MIKKQIQSLASFLKETGQFRILKEMATKHKKSEGCKKNWGIRRVKYARILE